MDIYLYYTIREADAVDARACVDALQRRVSNDYNITSALRRRPETRDGMQTWMEIYPGVPDRFDSVIEQIAAEVGVTALTTNGRHVEYFMELPPCA